MVAYGDQELGGCLGAYADQIHQPGSRLRDQGIEFGVGLGCLDSAKSVGGRAGTALHLAIRRHGRLGRPHGWVSPA